MQSKLFQKYRKYSNNIFMKFSFCQFSIIFFLFFPTHEKEKIMHNKNENHLTGKICTCFICHLIGTSSVYCISIQPFLMCFITHSFSRAQNNINFAFSCCFFQQSVLKGHTICKLHIKVQRLPHQSKYKIWKYTICESSLVPCHAMPCYALYICNACNMYKHLTMTIINKETEKILDKKKNLFFFNLEHKILLFAEWCEQMLDNETGRNKICSHIRRREEDGEEVDFHSTTGTYRRGLIFITCICLKHET